jgi:addiction module HigA family antidote
MDEKGASTVISSYNVASERRSAAPHPGPILKAEFFDPVGLTAAAFASKVGMDPALLQEMLAGRSALDVPTAIRIARTLQVPAEAIMQMQLKYEFALARNMPELRALEVYGLRGDDTFPESDFIPGHLGRATGEASANGSFFFQQDLERPVPGDQYAGLHALWRGDRLRIYAPAGGGVLWVGPVLQNLDGRLLLPYAQPTDWSEWFADGYRADLALGEDHRAFFIRMAE